MPKEEELDEEEDLDEDEESDDEDDDEDDEDIDDEHEEMLERVAASFSESDADCVSAHVMDDGTVEIVMNDDTKWKLTLEQIS